MAAGYTTTDEENSLTKHTLLNSPINIEKASAFWSESKVIKKRDLTIEIQGAQGVQGIIRNTEIDD